MWGLGFPDQALETNEQALSLAHEFSHPFTLAFAFFGMAELSQLRREVQATFKQAEAMIALSNEQGFPVWLEMGTILRAWSLAMQGDPAEGLNRMRQSMADKPVDSFYASRPNHWNSGPL